MIFSKSRPVKIVLVGTGGTGGYIVPQLYRLLYALDRPIRVILCDGDLVEEKNLGRQNFIEADLGKNKAMVLAERYSNAFGIETSYIPQYVEDEEMLEELLEPLQYPQNRYVTNQNGEAVRKVISEIVILIGAVDNNRSRQVFHSVFQRAKELIYIDSGNSKARLAPFLMTREKEVSDIMISLFNQEEIQAIHDYNVAKQAQETALKQTVLLMRDLGVAREEAVRQLAKRYDLLQNDAETAVRQYWTI